MSCIIILFIVWPGLEPTLTVSYYLVAIISEGVLNYTFMHDSTIANNV